MWVFEIIRKAFKVAEKNIKKLSRSNYKECQKERILVSRGKPWTVDVEKRTSAFKKYLSTDRETILLQKPELNKLPSEQKFQSLHPRTNPE